MRRALYAVQTGFRNAGLPRRRDVLLVLGATAVAGVSDRTPKAQTAPIEAPEKHPTTTPPSPSTPASAISGFRAARFGMTEDQVRQAIRKDFPAAAPRFKTATHPSEKTTVLSTTISDLLPNTGNAQVSYIFGYKSKKLIQVNVVWTSQGTPKSDENLVGTANMLRNYFSSQNYKPESVVANRQVAEHTILVFRASDVQGRMLLLLLNGAAMAARKEAKSPLPPPLTLELSYISDPAHPDVFRIPKGQF